MSIFIVMETARVQLHVHVYHGNVYTHTLMYMYNDNEYVNFVHFKNIYTLIIMFLKKSKVDMVEP